MAETTVKWDPSTRIHKSGCRSFDATASQEKKYVQRPVSLQETRLMDANLKETRNGEFIWQGLKERSEVVGSGELPTSKIHLTADNSTSASSGEREIPDIDVPFVDENGTLQGVNETGLRNICLRAEALFPKDTHIWPGYDFEDKRKIVIVAVVRQKVNGVPEQIEGLKLIQRQRDEVSKEAKLCQQREMEHSPFSADDHMKIHSCLAENSPSLFNQHSKLQIMSASPFKSQRYSDRNDENIHFEQTISIVLYVHIKGIIPLGEKEFPKKICDFSIDVREGCFRSFMTEPDALFASVAEPTQDLGEYHSNLKMGCRIQSAYKLSGSVGGFLRLPNKNIGFLTCWHLFDTHKSRNEYRTELLSHHEFKRDVFQPNPSEDHDHKIGKVVRAVKTPANNTGIGVDAALVEITETQREPRGEDLEENGLGYVGGEITKTFQDVANACEKKYEVHKWGARTGHTAGAIHISGAAVRNILFDMPSEPLNLHCQIEVRGKEFANRGDSGALVVLVSESEGEKEVHALGMVIGGNNANDTYYITPIWAILDSLGLPWHLLTFAEQRFKKLDSDIRSLNRDMKQGFNDLKAQMDKSFNALNDLNNQMKVLISRVDDK